MCRLIFVLQPWHKTFVGKFLVKRINRIVFHAYRDGAFGVLHGLIGLERLRLQWQIQFVHLAWELSLH